MKIKKILNFHPNFPLSEEQREKAKKGMEVIDITAAASALKGNDPTGAFSDYSVVKSFIKEIFHFALKEIGIKRNMKNFSGYHPINVLGDADTDSILRLAADILANELRAQRCQDIFFELYADEYDDELAAYAAKKGKTTATLTDDEHRKIAHGFTVKIGISAFQELLKAQKAVEIFNIAKDVPAFEDFDGKEYVDNFDWINFRRSYYHSRTKHAEAVNIEDVEKEISVNNGKRSIEDFFDMDGFLERLSEEERKILKLKEDGYRVAEIADMLGYKSQGTVSKKIKKMGKKVTDFLE